MLYDYECSQCGVMELDKKISEPEIEKCPKCNGKLKRKYAPLPWLNFKGACGKIGKL